MYLIFFLTYALNCTFNCVTLVDIYDRWRLPKVKKKKLKQEALGQYSLPEQNVI